MSKEENKKEEKSQKPNPIKNIQGRPKFNIYWVYGALALLFIGLQFIDFGKSEPKVISWEKFSSEILINNEVDKLIVVNGEQAEVFIKKELLTQEKFKDVNKGYKNKPNPGPHYIFTIGSIDVLEQRLQRVYDNNVEVSRLNLTYENRKDWTSDILSWILPIGLLIVFWIFIMRRMSGGAGGGGQIFNIGKSKAKLFDKDTHVTVNFNDVAGLEEAKVEIMEIVDFLKNPTKYTKLGGKIPKGVLLVGPPGTGKTLLAKAVAGEAQVPFFSMSGSDFVEMFVGVGASRVRDLFKQAKEKSPCIIFIDEIDAVGRARNKANFSGANDERENTLNQLLTEMDGFESNKGVIILAATNRADVLDRALLRAGRFDRQIQVEMPDLEERKAIFKVHTKSLMIDEKSVSIEFLAKQTPGFSGADIANVCNEAALIAARKDKGSIEKQDFLDAIDRIIGGLEKKNKIISVNEKKVIAFHEAGHASVSWLVEHAPPLIKVTIVPRGKALGAAWYLPEERQITTTEQMFDELTATLGGRAAEEIIFGKVSTGALNDLEKVTKQAFAMVAFFGLNEVIGNISYYDSSGQTEYSFTKPYSEKTAQNIDEEVSKIVESAYNRAKKILSDNKNKLERLASLLLEKEVIFKEDVEEIFGKRIYDSDVHVEGNDIISADDLEPNTIITGEKTEHSKNDMSIKNEENPKSGITGQLGVNFDETKD
ncbi:MAG: ATP-dependent zinc metalloprotease FtsH [Bacteroidales bacterium]|nr:ATP-dependent zinc metalloprotease FtsH [Bacteroidales bacterium]